MPGCAQQGPEFANVLHVIECKHSLDQLGAHFGAEHRSHQLARLSHYFIGRHRVLRSSSYMLDTLAELRPVGERNFDNRYPDGYQPLEFLIGNELDFTALAEHGWVLHAGLVMRGMKGNRFVDKHDRNQVL